MDAPPCALEAGLRRNPGLVSHQESRRRKDLPNSCEQQVELRVTLRLEGYPHPKADGDPTEGEDGWIASLGDVLAEHPQGLEQHIPRRSIWSDHIQEGMDWILTRRNREWTDAR